MLSSRIAQAVRVILTGARLGAVPRDFGVTGCALGLHATVLSFPLGLWRRTVFAVRPAEGNLLWVSGAGGSGIRLERMVWRKY